MHENRIYTLIFGVYECLKWGFMLKKGAWRGIFEKRWVCMMVWETAGTVVLKENSCNKRKQLEPFMVNCTPFVRQYDILNNKWGDFLCQKE